MKHAIIIPSRFASNRFPGKPLAMINKVPMIIRTYNQCLKATSKEYIFVTTDNNRIYDVCKESNIQCLMTSKSCLTGTDRVAQASKEIDSKFIINVQGDEPLINP